MSSCLLPTLQLLQPSTTNPILRPKLSSKKPQPARKRARKAYPRASAKSPTSRLSKMRLSVLKSPALLSLVGLGTAQSTSSWGEPFNVDVSTDSLLGSSAQPLTNVVGGSTPVSAATTASPGSLTAGSETTLAPVVPVTDAFSTSVPTELGSVGSGSATGVVTVTSSVGGSASGSVSSRASASASASGGSATSRASSSGTGTAVQSTAAAAPGGVQGQHKLMGFFGALAGAAGVVFA